ncbi:MAG: SspB family protein [Methyloceanibacter sp.]|uniref:SspB family protein n=1 Tax=Methyloceanibacter sp. TaxID=1965321 RepID=UPI003D9BD5BE
MAANEIRYDVLTQDALRGVVRQVLTLVQRNGLPGDHHLYIAFDTCADGVSISKRLKEQYPEEMTVVLQYQFWDLQVTNDRFEVKLSFYNVPERLVVPFRAVKAFYDPSAQFGLQFGKPGAANDSARQHLAAALPDLVGDSDEHRSTSPETSNDDNAEAAPAKVTLVKPPAEIVQLDHFRKK